MHAGDHVAIYEKTRSFILINAISMKDELIPVIAIKITRTRSLIRMFASAGTQNYQGGRISSRFFF